ncbi:peptidylprolyl isomerase [Chloroflexota bacterium]
MKHIFPLLIGILLMAACNGNAPIDQTPFPSQTESSTPDIKTTSSPTPFSLPTTEPGTPLAAIINGQAITLSEYHAEVARAQSVSEKGLTTYTEADVLQNLIDEVLLAQAAVEEGFIVDEDIIQTRIDQLVMDDLALEDWLTENGYTLESFESAYSRAFAATWMRDQIIFGVPSTAEQVHARQILLYNSEEAENAYGQIQVGTDFATLAVQYDPITSGELGWFPRGYLTVPELDEPIFSLQAGEHTQIIETILGFHIVQVIERDPQHILSPDALHTLQVRAVENWLVERRSQSEIQILLS